MKLAFQLRFYLPVIIFIFFSSVSCKNISTNSSNNVADSIITQYIHEIMQMRNDINHEFSDSSQSPLDKEDIAHFTGLKFFKPDYNYRVKAKFIRTKNEEPFKMPTTTERMPEYVKYGELHFSISDSNLVLSAYQSLDLVNDSVYFDYLFIPFTDLTNGFSTYGGGRYLDIRYHGEDTVILDFNKCYNPYCAYASRWSCPIPPEENFLNISIKAGVKSYH
ncbi:MAG: DUF1684 domain-containing protein [Chlorobi bacterium]|nr:DUF1684 domain-containing protein [Chlorobiota bacterium]